LTPPFEILPIHLGVPFLQFNNTLSWSASWPFFLLQISFSLFFSFLRVLPSPNFSPFLPTHPCFPFFHLMPSTGNYFFLPEGVYYPEGISLVLPGGFLSVVAPSMEHCGGSSPFRVFSLKSTELLYAAFPRHSEPSFFRPRCLWNTQIFFLETFFHWGQILSLIGGLLFLTPQAGRSSFSQSFLFRRAL